MNQTIQAINKIVSEEYTKLLRICVSKLPKKFNLQESDDMFHEAYCTLIRFPGVAKGEIDPENITIQYLVATLYLIMKRRYINDWKQSKKFEEVVAANIDTTRRYCSPDLTPEFLDLISNFDEKETKYLRARIEGKSLRQIVRDGIVKDWVEFNVYDELIREKLTRYYLIGLK